MNKEEMKDALITKEDLVAWIDRPPSNDDLDLCSYLSNAVKNQFAFSKKIEQLQQENKQLKEKLKIKHDGFMASTEELCEYATNWENLKQWLEEEQERLAREVSNTYEDDLGNVRYVNEDIFNEISNILSKMQEIRGKDV